MEVWREPDQHRFIFHLIALYSIQLTKDRRRGNGHTRLSETARLNRVGLSSTRSSAAGAARHELPHGSQALFAGFRSLPLARWPDLSLTPAAFLESKGKAHRPFSPHRAFLSGGSVLPAGASSEPSRRDHTKDDSDPLWGRVEACNNAIYAGPHDPHFFGGSLSSYPIFLDRHGVVRLVGDNYRRLREIRKICCGTSLG